METPRLEPGQQRPQGGKVKHVLEALAVGLEHDREGAVAPGDLEERLCLEPLLPARRPLSRPWARNQQRPRGVLAEPGTKESSLAELAHDEVLALARVEDEILR